MLKRGIPIATDFLPAAQRLAELQIFYSGIGIDIEKKNPFGLLRYHLLLFGVFWVWVLAKAQYLLQYLYLLFPLSMLLESLLDCILIEHERGLRYNSDRFLFYKEPQNGFGSNE